jgi:hypothetical protein
VVSERAYSNNGTMIAVSRAFGPIAIPANVPATGLLEGAVPQLPGRQPADPVACRHQQHAKHQTGARTIASPTN